MDERCIKDEYCIKKDSAYSLYGVYHNKRLMCYKGSESAALAVISEDKRVRFETGGTGIIYMERDGLPVLPDIRLAWARRMI